MMENRANMHFLVIGVGSIGKRHLRALSRIEGVACSIAEPDDAMRERVAADHDVRAAYADYRDADLASFDGAVICVPTNLHVPMAAEIISCGTHVLIEKPLAMKPDGIDDLKRLRDAKGVVASVAFTLRSDPVVRELRERVQAGEFGATHAVHLYSGGFWPEARQDYPPAYAMHRDTGGGVIPDMLIHWLNFLEWIFGPPESVSAQHDQRLLMDIGTEDVGFVTLRFPQGPVAQLGMCMFQRDGNLQWQIIAEHGTYRVLLDSPHLDVFAEAAGKWAPGRDRRGDRDDTFLRQARHFIDCIEGRDAPRCPLEDGEQTLRTVLAALQSADGDSRFVPVPGS